MPEFLSSLLCLVEAEGFNGRVNATAYGTIFHFKRQYIGIRAELIGMCFHLFKLSITLPPYIYIIGGGVDVVHKRDNMVA